jgi:eukaryotic-like serine/threonine-protein kinase
MTSLFDTLDRLTMMRSVAPAESEPAPYAETTFGKYQLLASLGHGGMADVFLTVVHGPVGFNKLQVLKRLRPHLAEEHEFLMMFLDEARLAARLNHPNVVQTNEVGEHNGRYFIAMEYLDGQPLNRIIHRANKMRALPRAVALKIVSDALAGLHYAHDLADYDGTPLGVVHRDASPHNIFVTYDGQTKVVDFGIAKASTRSLDTRAGMLKGKIAYMSPEQARCEPVDRRSDICAIGVLLWELTAGVPLWKGLGDIEILERISQAKYPLLRDVCPGVPPMLEAIVSRALAATPDERYASAAELRADLNEYMDAEGYRPSAEDIGQFVRSLFDDKRAEIKRIIARQLSGLKAGDVSLVEMNNSLSSSTTSLLRGSQPRLMEGTPTNQLALAAAGRPSVSGAARLRVSAIVGSCLVAAVAIGAFVLLRADNTPAGAPAAKVSGVGSSESTAKVEAPRLTSVDVKINAEPAAAKLFLDEAPLPANPFAGKFAADGANHRIRIEAPGFVTRHRMAVFDRDILLDIKLDPEPTANPDKPKPQGITAPQPAAAPAIGQPGKPSKRRLDSSDPWQ